MGKRENRECIYRFVAPNDQRNSIFGQWLNRDELFLSESVSVTNNIELQTAGIDTTPIDIPQTVNQVENPIAQDSIGSSYSELASTIGETVGVADGEPFWNGYLGQWQIAVNFASGCK